MSRQLFIVPEHEFEPVRGLPEALPAGERMRWQGAPDWTVLAIEVFHARKLAIYFAVILVLRAGFAVNDGASITGALFSAFVLLPLALIALGLVLMLAWLTARTTVYTITDQRVVMRIGIVLSVTFNLPFSALEAVSIRHGAHGAGDLPLSISAADQIAYLHLWPHVRPWRFKKTEPMLRAIPNVVEVANLLTSAIAESTGGIATPITASASSGVKSQSLGQSMVTAS
jgi:Bacterial PH domain